jgi:hypothetical protein
LILLLVLCHHLAPGVAARVKDFETPGMGI